jgi:hypothetical protein
MLRVSPKLCVFSAHPWAKLQYNLTEDELNVTKTANSKEASRAYKTKNRVPAPFPRIALTKEYLCPRSSLNEAQALPASLVIKTNHYFCAHAYVRIMRAVTRSPPTGF